MFAAIGGEEFKVVSPGYLESKGIEIPDDSGEEGIATVVYLLKGKEPVGSIALSDRIRDLPHDNEC